MTAYCVLADVKTALGMTASTDDAFISSLIPQAQAMIDTELGYSFQSVTATKSYDGTGKPKLFIGEVISVTTVMETIYPFVPTIYGTPWLLTPTSQEISSDCVIGPTSSPVKYQLLRKSGERFSVGVANYQVTGVFGFSSVPLDATRACIRLVIHMYKMRDTNYADKLAEMGNIVQHFSKACPADVQTILDRLKHRNFY